MKAQLIIQTQCNAAPGGWRDMTDRVYESDRYEVARATVRLLVDKHPRDRFRLILRKTTETTLLNWSRTPGEQAA